MKREIQEDRLKLFIPNARMLSPDEQAALPNEKRNAAYGKSGLWIEVPCPESACSVEAGKITLPAEGVIPQEAKGIWISLFCPEDQCEIVQSTDLP